MLESDREGAVPGRTGLVRTRAARAAVVLALLWIGTAVLLRAQTDEFGPMIAILASASAVLWDSGAPRGDPLRLVLWVALLAATTVLLWGSPRLPGELVLLGAAAAWFLAAEPLLRRRRAA